MKISLYPIADGFLCPDEVLDLARSCLQTGQRVAISTGDPEFNVLSGAVMVRRVGKAFNAFHAIKPSLAIIDALDFTDPDGEEIISRQEMPHSPPVSVAGDQFLRMLDLLRERSGTGEVLLVSDNDTVSESWKERLARWDVVIRWELANSRHWRTWIVGDERTGPLDDVTIPIPQAAEPYLCVRIHSARSQLLLTLASEFSDIYCRDGDSSHLAGVDLKFNLSRQLFRMLAGKPIAERIRHCRQLEDDFLYLAYMAGEYVRALKGANGPEDSLPPGDAGSRPSAPAQDVSGSKLH